MCSTLLFSSLDQHTLLLLPQSIHPIFLLPLPSVNTFPPPLTHTLLSLPDPHAITSHKQFVCAILEYGGHSKWTTEMFEESTPLGITKKFFKGLKVE